jgi:hypothetical protein
MPASTNCSTPSGTVGMFAPSLTSMTPFASRFFASSAPISFCVAHGNAQSASWSHSGFESPAASCAVKIAP